MAMLVLFADAGNFLQLHLVREVPKPPSSPLNRSATMPPSVRHFGLRDDVCKTVFFKTDVYCFCATRCIMAMFLSVLLVIRIN